MKVVGKWLAYEMKETEIVKCIISFLLIFLDLMIKMKHGINES